MTDASLAETRDSYDALAAGHPDWLNSDLDDRPLDRALLAAFAELVRAGGNGPVADVGCGSGRVTTLLSDLGLDAFGVDVSPGMVSLARRNHPQLRFDEGSMLELDILWTTAIRQPEGSEKVAQGYILARKPQP